MVLCLLSGGDARYSYNAYIKRPRHSSWPTTTMQVHRIRVHQTAATLGQSGGRVDLFRLLLLNDRHWVARGSLMLRKALRSRPALISAGSLAFVGDTKRELLDISLNKMASLMAASESTSIVP